jgi:hypothetical protein
VGEGLHVIDLVHVGLRDTLQLGPLVGRMRAVQEHKLGAERQLGLDALFRYQIRRSSLFKG